MSVALTGDTTRYAGPARSAGYRWFTDPAARQIYAPAEHPFLTRMYAAGLRELVTLRGPGSPAVHLAELLLARSEEFRRVIRSVFQGPKGASVRKTIRQGEPIQDRHLTINSEYPERLPVTTVPPTLLLRLPQLPPEVAYRIIGHDFVLEDIEARVVVDFIPGALP